ncbi:MAG: hypothetical protein NC121_10075 [Blautia sp.]|nr:hypothetical protein [Blautia sp.]
MKVLKGVLGIALIAVGVIVFWNRRIPIYQDLTFNVMESQDLPVLPGDCVTQDISLSCDRLEKVSVAFSYSEEISEEAKALVEVLSEGETVMSQELRVNACVNGSFLDFLVGLDGCEGRTVTLSVSNVTPEDVSGGEFSLMSSDKDFLFVDGIGVCRVNGSETDSCIFSRAVCVSGYSYYEAATAAFLILLAGVVVMEWLDRKYQGKR